ncbi:MAG: putative ABC transporter permease [Treponema sp.]|nr:putative ABC transporter permease [Treponema sp.]
MSFLILGTKITDLILIFFGLGFAGWLAESINETITRKKFVNKGFFKGPFALSHAIGGVCVYAIGLPLKQYPILVFFAGLLICTVIEYIMAIFLEKCFKVKCWDYTTYPHTKWCNFQGRIALTISLFFGFITLFVVYIYWDFMLFVCAKIGNTAVLIADIILCVLFLFDVIFTCARILKAKKTGDKVKGYAVFSEFGE